MLYAKGYSRENVLKLFRFIDWLMALPDELEQGFWKEISDYEKENKMPYITSVERIGIQQGIRRGLLKGIEVGLELKFGMPCLNILSEIQGIENPDILNMIQEGLKTVSSPDELRKFYN